MTVPSDRRLATTGSAARTATAGCVLAPVDTGTAADATGVTGDAIGATGTAAKAVTDRATLLTEEGETTGCDSAGICARLVKFDGNDGSAKKAGFGSGMLIGVA